MAASGGVDVANLVIEGSCTFQDYGVVQMNDGDYRLLAITNSGNLVPAQPINMEVCVVGGGANGTSGGPGGAGAYMKNQVIEAFEGGAVVVGAGQGVSSIADVSVNKVSGRNGGTGAGGNAAGTGDGLSKYPFEDTGYSLWSGKPHCAGGGQGMTMTGRSGYDGGRGGTNGGNGYPQKEKPISYPFGGGGGSYGGGRGGSGNPANGGNATYYGSGGGGGSYEDSAGNLTLYNGGSGYQGIVYMRIPEDQAA